MEHIPRILRDMRLVLLREVSSLGEHHGLCILATRIGREMCAAGADPDAVYADVAEIKHRIKQNAPIPCPLSGYFWTRDWSGMEHRLALMNKLIREDAKGAA